MAGCRAHANVGAPGSSEGGQPRAGRSTPTFSAGCLILASAGFARAACDPELDVRIQLCDSPSTGLLPAAAVDLSSSPSDNFIPSPGQGIDRNLGLALNSTRVAGCAVVISHDRWFLDRIATHVLAFEDAARELGFAVAAPV